MNKIAISTLGLLLAASPCSAASLTLGCSGMFTTSHLPKNGMQSEPVKENIVDFSVVVDLDKMVVTGFWSFDDGTANGLPIVAVSPNNVTFKSRVKRVSEKSIEGTVDRITGKVDVEETQLYSTGNLTMLSWDLRCRPTKPLF